MASLTLDGIFWLSCLAQVVGLTLAVAARERGSQGWWLQIAFFAGMALLGAAAIAAFTIGSGCWASCGATLSIMAVGATADFPAPAHPAEIY